MVEWSITVVLKTTVLRGTGGSNPSLSARKSRVALFVYAIRVLTFFQSLRFMKAPLRVEREYQMKPRGRVFYQPREKTIVRKSSHWDIGQTWND